MAESPRGTITIQPYGASVNPFAKYSAPEQSALENPFAKYGGSADMNMDAAFRFDRPENAAKLEEALQSRATQMTRGPEVPVTSQLLTQHRNLLSGAQQRTNPNPEVYRGNLVSIDTYEDEAGQIQYKDPATGELRLTDSKTQVALRDPADGRIKIFQRSDDTDEEGIFGAARVLAPGFAAGAPTRAASLPSPPKIPEVRASDIFATGKPHYREFDNIASQIVIPPYQTSEIVQRVKSAVQQKVPEHLADEVLSSVGQFGSGGPKELTGLQRLQAEMNRLPTLSEGSPTPLSALRDTKEAVGKSFESPDPRIRQAAALATSEIMKIINEIFPSAGDSLRKADQINSSARKVQQIQRLQDASDLRTSRAGYGANAVNNIRGVLTPIVENHIKGKFTGFKPDEIKAMTEIINGTLTTNTLRLAGMASPYKGIISNLGNVGATIVTTAATGPAGLSTAVVIPVLGGASNKLATILTVKQLDRLKDLIAKRSPEYAAAVRKSVERYEQAQEKLLLQPSPSNFAAYVSTSRALSSGLTRDGIEISSGTLLKNIQGTAPLRTQSEQEQ